MRPAKTQISLGIRPVWSESSLCTQWVAKGPSFLHADSENSDQTWRMPRLICLRWAHTHFVVFFTRRLIYWLIHSDFQTQELFPWRLANPINKLVLRTRLFLGCAILSENISCIWKSMWINPYILHRRTANAQASPRIRAVSPESSLFAPPLKRTIRNFRQRDGLMTEHARSNHLKPLNANIPFSMKRFKYIIYTNGKKSCDSWLFFA